MEKEEIRHIGFDQIEGIRDVDYKDEGFAFHTDIRELHIEHGSMRVEMFTILACIKGRLQMEKNGRLFNVGQNDVLMCNPNDILDNCLMSPDFEGAILCLSQRGIVGLISESDLWDRIFHLAQSPLIHVSDDGARHISFYGQMLRDSISMPRTTYRRQVIASIIQAALYEMLDITADGSAIPHGEGLIHQGEVLFKSFIKLLTECKVKPRRVTWYANQLCITPKYLSFVCKQVSGKTALEWINEYVLIDVRHWLKNSDRSIKEIADLLDFPNISFFGKYCRAHLGMSPMKYRRELRGKGVNS
jgi:AraC-like DNA-binding protein